MAELKINIPADKVNRVITALRGLYPIPQIKDPENPGEFIDEFNDVQWARKILVNYLKNRVQKYERKMAQNAIEIIDLS